MKCPFCQKDLKWMMTEGRKFHKDHIFVERHICQNSECKMVAIEMEMINEQTATESQSKQ
jgi:hypothetical protein